MSTIPRVYHTRFSRDWNGAKLQCDFFTTFRMYDAKKYALGTVHEIWLNDRQLGKAAVVSHERGTAATLTDRECWLDTGYNAADTKRLLCKIYSKPSADALDLSKVVFQYVKRY